MTFVVHCKMEKHDIYIGRPGPWGNPFSITDKTNRDQVCDRHHTWVMAQPWYVEAIMRELPGKTLGCFCDPKRCHGDLLSAIANPREDEQGNPVAPPVFVFGSNLAGRHGKGAAKVAKRDYGAEQGDGLGMTGCSYALPTKNDQLETLPLARVEEEVHHFLEVAREKPDVPFLVTKVGCGLAGFDEALIAPLFEQAPDNVFLPGQWQRMLKGKRFYPRVIVAGSRDFEDYNLLKGRLDDLLSHLDNPVIVSGAARGADQLGEQYAIERGLPFERFPAWWRTQGRSAGASRNARMAWRGTHLAAFQKGASKGTQVMIDMAKQENIETKVIKV